jgi:hypothetical protein
VRAISHPMISNACRTSQGHAVRHTAPSIHRSRAFDG